MSFSCLIDGQPRQQLAVTDRALAYGDGLFETCRVIQGQVPLFDYHWQRLSASAKRLNIPLNLDADTLRQQICEVVSGKDGIAKLILTRGSGGRGYRCPEQPDSHWILQGMPLPETPHQHYQNGVSLRRCHLQLSEQPRLAGMKHLNRLEQVLARQEWQDEVFEGLLFSRSGLLIEATMANIFLLQGDRLLTPKLDLCGVQGVMRDRLMRLSPDERQACGLTTVGEAELKAQDLQQADAVFLCNSVRGILPVSGLYTDDGRADHLWASAQHPVLQALTASLHPWLKLPLNRV